MKTINNAHKTENRNNEHSTLKTVAIIALALVGFIFSANAAANNHPLLVAGNATAPSYESVSLPASYTEAAMEENLEVESWMTNEYLFAPVAVAETEEPLAVEEWMINNEYFMEATFVQESEPLLEVESWMLDTVNFSTFTIAEDTEKALEVEAWMLNESTWGQ